MANCYPKRFFDHVDKYRKLRYAKPEGPSARGMARFFKVVPREEVQSVPVTAEVPATPLAIVPDPCLVVFVFEIGKKLRFTSEDGRMLFARLETVSKSVGRKAAGATIGKKTNVGILSPPFDHARSLN